MRRGDEFLRAWIKRSEIRFVPAASLIDHREKLKVNLIQTACKVNGERLTVDSRYDSSQKSGRQTPLQ